MVNGSSMPDITGPSFGLEYGTDVFSILNNQGSSYIWGLDIGNIIFGQNSSVITVEWTSDGLATLWVLETNIFGCISDTIWYSLEIGAVTAIDEESVHGLLVYPNPTKDIITIQFNSSIIGDYKITLVDGVGQDIFIDKLSLFSGNYFNKIDLTGYSKGIYILNISTGNGSIIKKITLQ